MANKELVSKIENNWNSLIQEVNDLCHELNRNPPRIVAVSKTRSIEEIRAAIEFGITDFGENYADELQMKAEQIPDVNFHFIGNLQRRNAKKIVEHVVMIHSISSKKIIDRLINLDYDNKALIQVNIALQSSKTGISISEINDLLDYAKSKNFVISGFMTIGNQYWNETEIDENFSIFANQTRKYNLPELSMGMSQDWRIAVANGATILRIGTGIFGPRKTVKSN